MGFVGIHWWIGRVVGTGDVQLEYQFLHIGGVRERDGCTTP